MKKSSLRERAGQALIVFGLAMSIIGSAACDSNDSGVVGVVTTAPSFNTLATATILPSFVGLTSLSPVGCSGFAFGASFNVIVVSTGMDMTMDSITVHLIDGTNLGGPMVTIPSSQLNEQFGSTIVRAGRSRTFPLHPVFGCGGTFPHSLAATVLLLDQFGRPQTLNVQAGVVR